MSHGKTIYLGTLAALQSHFEMRLKQRPYGTSDALIILVPTPRFRDALRRRYPEASNIMAIDDWIEQFLPQHIIPAPWGTWEILSRLVPIEVLDHSLSSTPGIRALVVQHLRDAWAGGLRPMAAKRSSWNQLALWYGQKFRGAIADDSRIREWAKQFVRPEGEVWVYGFSDWSRGQWGFIDAWSRTTEVQIWVADALLETAQRESILRQATIIGVSDLGPPGPIRAIVSENETLHLDHIADIIREQGLRLSDVVFSSVNDSRERAIIRALARQGVVDPIHRERPRSAVLWDLFLLVAQGKAREVVHARWARDIDQASSEEASRWAIDWWRRVTTVSDWSAFGPLVEEAARFHGLREEWAAILKWARELAVFAEWIIPPDIAGLLPRAGQALLGFPSEITLLPPDEAAWMPAEYRIVFGVGTEFPRHETPSPFQRDPEISAFISRHRKDAVILREMSQLQGTGYFLLDEDPQHLGLSFVEVLRLENSEVSWFPGDQKRVIQWYHDWRTAREFTDYTGLISGISVDKLLPEYFSPSALETFGRCPMCFFLQRMLRVSRVGDAGMEIDPRLVGQWAHRVLELVVQKRKPLSRELIADLVSQAIEEASPPSSVAKFHLQYQRERLTAELYEALLRDNWDPSLVSRTEVELQWETLWPMRGRLDRVDTLSDGTARIIDYKTGVVTNPRRITPTSLQLALYEVALRDLTGRPVSAELMGISQRSQFIHRQLDSLSEAIRRDQLLKIQQGMHLRIENGQFFPAPDTGKDPCRACDYRLVCPARVLDLSAVKMMDYPDYQSLWRLPRDEEVQV